MLIIIPTMEKVDGMGYKSVRLIPLFHICKLKNDVTMKKFYIFVVGIFTSLGITATPVTEIKESFLEEYVCSSSCSIDNPCSFCKSLAETEESIYNFIKDGMRFIDVSIFPNAEEAVGRGIERAINEGFCQREDLFITVKMAAYCDNPNITIEYFLQKLHVSYIDLCILLESDGKERNDDVFFCLMEASSKGIVRSVVVSNASNVNTVSTFINDFSLMPEVSSK